MSERNWKLFIDDILESIQWIEKYVKGMNYDEFSKDRKTIDAVVRNLGIIGEATNNIPKEIRDRFSDIDWKGLSGLRNRIVHDYFGIDITIVWKIISDEIKDLKGRIAKIKDVV